MRKPRLVLLCLFVVQTILCAGCQHDSVQIEYVFPDGFRGPAVIRENQPGGVPPCKIRTWAPGTYRCVLDVPHSGVLPVQGESPGGHWHTPSARYVSGKIIPVPDSVRGISVSKEDIALWTFGSIQHGEDWLFIGTEGEFVKFKDEKHGYTYPH